MDQALVVDMLIPLRGLGLAVQDQAATVKVRLQHFHLLVFGSCRKREPAAPFNITARSG